MAKQNTKPLKSNYIAVFHPTEYKTKARKCQLDAEVAVGKDFFLGASILFGTRLMRTATQILFFKVYEFCWLVMRYQFCRFAVLLETFFLVFLAAQEI